MKLLFDVGNTRIKWAYDSGGELVHAGEAVHRGQERAEIVARIAMLEQPADQIWAVNVAGKEVAGFLNDAVARRFGTEPVYVSTSRNCGQVINGYEDVSQHGADRWAAVVGAWHRYKTDLCVVDVGTAVTLDLVQADGQHLGGFILPGIRLMTEALHRDTSDIEAFSARNTGNGEPLWCGNDTLSAVQLGALFALRAAVKESAGRLGKAARVVITGGDANTLLPIDGYQSYVHPLLVLEGLQQLVTEK